MTRYPAFALPLALLAAAPPPADQATADRAAIGALLETYTAAVSHKDQALFETLLLGKDIPFAYVPDAPTAGAPAAWRDYDGFRRGVFGGPPFTQTFRDVTVRLHGALADVDLVYVNTDAGGAHPGWKTMQLLKVDGRWRIASEFFTDLPQPRPAGSARRERVKGSEP